MTDPSKTTAEKSGPDKSAKARRLSPNEVEAAVEDLRRELNQIADAGGVERIDCNQESIEQGLAKLVLGLIELLRRLLERQAVRRMEGGSLSDQQVEDMGLALMKLEQKIGELAGSFGLTVDDLNLELGPLGKLLDK
jgi:hypothetical protein